MAATHARWRRWYEGIHRARDPCRHFGCFCNPGAGEAAFHVTRDTVKPAFDGERDVTTYDDYDRVLDLPTMGSMRVSLGVASNFLDVHRFLRFMDTFIH